MRDDQESTTHPALQAARRAQQRGDLAKAETLLMSVRNHPRVAVKANVGLAALYFQRNDLDRVFAFVSRASALAGQPDDALYFVGRGLENLHSLAEAERAYSTVLSMNPHHQAARTAVEQVRRMLSRAGPEVDTPGSVGLNAGSS